MDDRCFLFKSPCTGRLFSFVILSVVSVGLPVKSRSLAHPDAGGRRFATRFLYGDEIVRDDFWILEYKADDFIVAEGLAASHDLARHSDRSSPVRRALVISATYPFFLVRSSICAGSGSNAMSKAVTDLKWWKVFRSCTKTSPMDGFASSAFNAAVSSTVI